MIIFSAELQSKKHHPSIVFFSSRCSGLRKRAVNISSVVEQLGLGEEEYLMMVDGGATGQQSFRHVLVNCLGNIYYFS